LFTNIHPFKKPYVPPTPPEGMSDDEKERYRAAARQRAELAIMRETLNTIETLTQDKAAMAKKLEKVPFASMRPILLKMLSFDPEDRYQDYDQLIADFENAAKEEEKL
jgi:serine/threonine protein kinase